MMDYVDMMKAWEMELLVQYEENRRGRKLHNDERPHSPAGHQGPTVGESTKKGPEAASDSMAINTLNAITD
jgi:hypothetical protein